MSHSGIVSGPFQAVLTVLRSERNLVFACSDCQLEQQFGGCRVIVFMVHLVKQFDECRVILF